MKIVRKISNFPFFLCQALAFVACVAGVGGCTRAKYRAAADREAYCLVESRQTDSRWELPDRSVEPNPISRMHVDANTDCPPKPMDDLAAKGYMDHPKCIDNTHYYSQIPTRSHTENPIWLDYLPRDENDRIQIDLPLAQDLALVHSRDYQTQFEAVYLTALNLSGNRFEFDCQWFGGLGSNFLANGDDLGGARRLGVADDLGFARNLAGGGQIATSLLNGLFWDFGNSGISGGTASLVTTFTQPLLRGAFRHVRLEGLTQAERNLLYQVRDFARFRRLFYSNITNSYLSLLTQVQAIRNTRTNVQNLRNSLDEYEVYIDLGVVSPVEVDQVYQNYQSGRLSLLASEQQLAQSMDAFKFQLGLPPWVPLEIDEAMLSPFELVDTRLEQLQNSAQELYQRIVQFLPPEIAPKELLDTGYAEYLVLREQVAERLPEIEAELATWQARLDSIATEEVSPDDQIDFQQQSSSAERIEQSLREIRARLAKRDVDAQRLRESIDVYHMPWSQSPESTKETVDATDQSQTPDGESLRASRTKSRRDAVTGNPQDQRPEIRAWRALLEAVGGGLREEIAELYVAQTQIRLFLIDIDFLDVQEQTAITFAHQNRLDVMNERARVMDAFRRVEVAADALESELNLTGGVTLGSDPGINNAFRLDSSANTYRAGVQFDGPLNRLNERNNYRAAQVAYQRASRDFVGVKDSVANEVRSVLRQLELRRLNFQIARQQLVAATRQVDQAQIDLRTSNSANANLTLFLLQALQQLLNAKNNLISEWVRYRVEKIRLFTTLELLYLDEGGQWINEDDGLQELSQTGVIDPEYFPPGWVTLPGAKPDNATSSDSTDGPGIPAEQLPMPPPADDAQVTPRRQIQGQLPVVNMARALDLIKPGRSGPTAAGASQDSTQSGALPQSDTDL